MSPGIVGIGGLSNSTMVHRSGIALILGVITVVADKTLTNNKTVAFELNKGFMTEHLHLGSSNDIHNNSKEMGLRFETSFMASSMTKEGNSMTTGENFVIMIEAKEEVISETIECTKISSSMTNGEQLHFERNNVDLHFVVKTTDFEKTTTECLHLERKFVRALNFARTLTWGHHFVRKTTMGDLHFVRKTEDNSFVRRLGDIHSVTTTEMFLSVRTSGDPHLGMMSEEVRHRANHQHFAMIVVHRHSGKEVPFKEAAIVGSNNNNNNNININNNNNNNNNNNININNNNNNNAVHLQWIFKEVVIVLSLTSKNHRR
jgi:hypothetical protein